MASKPRELKQRKIQGASNASPKNSLIYNYNSGLEIAPNIKLQIEAILFSAESPLDLGQIRNLLGDVSLAEVKHSLQELAVEYENRAFFLVEKSNTYQLRTRAEFNFLLTKLFASQPRSLSKAAMETLAIIAYRQPVTRAEINNLRNVDSSTIIAALVEKELVTANGRRKEVGNPFEYKTTDKFLQTFGLGSLKELPSLRSLQISPEEQSKIAGVINELSTAVPESTLTE